MLLERFGWARHAMRATILFLWLLNAMILSLHRFKLQLTDGFTNAFHEAILIVAIVILLLVQLTLLPSHLLLLSERAFPRTGDLACRWQAWLGESLLRRKIIILDKRLAVVVMEFTQEPTLEKTNLVLSGLDGDRLELGWLRHNDTSSSNIAVVLPGICIVHPVL